ncbi:MAG: OmpA family protein [Belnapia sp.]|nr:OmpA family protein [Belnapia sp.]
MRRRHLLAALPLFGLAACQTPAAPPPPQTVVFFNADSAALDDNAMTLIAAVATRAKASPAAPVRVRGFSAPDGGSAAFNRALAEARAQNVADELAKGGVDRSRIRLEPRGAVPFEMMATESRRVEVLIGQ